MNERVISRPNDPPEQLTLRAGRAGTDHDREVPEIDLLSPVRIRGVDTSRQPGRRRDCPGDGRSHSGHRGRTHYTG
jgi:hypothetical protein